MKELGTDALISRIAPKAKSKRLLEIFASEDQSNLEEHFGPVLATKLRVAYELGRRSVLSDNNPFIKEFPDPSAVVEWATSRLIALDYEEVWVLMLTAKNKLRHAELVSRGGVFGAALSPRDVLRVVLRDGCAGYILVHNHPSGDPTPSDDDIRTTEAIAIASKVVGVPLLDHVIVGREGHHSLYELIAGVT